MPADPEWEAFIRAGEDLGSDHFVKREYSLPDGRHVSYPAGDGPPPGEGVFIGLEDSHVNRATGEWCGGWIGFANVVDSHPESRHELVTARPLTVRPSLACRRCSSHGFIENGAWREV
jgi:hypothetical protein